MGKPDVDEAKKRDQAERERKGGRGRKEKDLLDLDVLLDILPALVLTIFSYSLLC